MTGASATPLPGATAAKGAARFAGLDLARSIAMLLAMATHIIVQVYDRPVLPDAAGALLRLSTPMFIILFGAMIPIVHVRRRERNGAAALWQKALSRALQCYLLYALNVASLVVDGRFGLPYAAACLLFVGSTPYAAILRYYTVLFVLLPALVVVVRRYGAIVPLVGAIAVHLAFPLYVQIPAPPPIGGGPFLERLTNFFFGVGRQLAGPSIMHSFAFVFMGAWGSVLLVRRARGERITQAADVAVVALLSAMIVFSLVVSRPINLHELGGMTLRNTNHPAFAFITGGAALLAILGLALTLRNVRLPSWTTLLSRRSLFTFGFGNVVVAVWPAAVAQTVGATASAILLGCAILLLVWGYDVALRGGGGMAGNAIRRLAHGTTDLIDRSAERFVDAVRLRKVQNAVA